MRSLRTGLHVHHRRLLVTLLGTLVVHHLRNRSWAVGIAVRAGSARHLTRILLVPWARCLRVHRHLRVARHAHERSVRRVVRHHVASHGWSWCGNELTRTLLMKGHALHIRAHAILRHLHLLRVAMHLLRLTSVHVRGHGPRRRVHRGIGIGELHLLCFIGVRRLAMMRLDWWASRRMMWCRAVRALEVNR